MQQCDLVAAPGGYYNHDNILIGRHIMKKKIVRRMLLAILALGLLLGSIPAVLGAENLFDPENAFDELYLEEAEDRPGVFTNQNSANGSTGSETFCLPGLTKNYTFSGHIKILEIGQESWTGVRLIIGSDQTGQCSLVITKDWRIRFEFMGFNMNDQFWDNAQLRLAKDTEFDFEVTRAGNRVSLRLNETEEGTIEIPEEYDAFDEENDYNLGFKAEQCLFEVSDIAVYCDETEANRPPESTAAPSEPPTATGPEDPADPETPPQTGDANAIFAVAAAGIVLTVLIKKKAAA